MKTLTILALLCTSILAANVAQAKIQFYAPHPDVIRVKSQPAVANFEIYSLAKARQSIDQVQALVHDQIKASSSDDFTQINASSSVSDAT